MKFVDNIFQKFTHDIGIDLGTANTLVSLSGMGVVIDEPSVVAINKNTNEVLAVGAEARHMIGRTPSHIVSVSPLEDGVINDFDSTEAMIRYFIRKVHKDYSSSFMLSRPRLVIGVPSKVTEVEIRAVVDAAMSAGARKVYLIEEPMAAAIGARMPIEDATGNMIIDIGGGTTDIAVISLGGIIVDRSLRVAGNEMDEAIVEYVRKKYNLLMGLKMAEDVKIKIGAAIPLKKKLDMEIRGRDLVTGLPKAVSISSVEVSEAILPVLLKILEAAKEAIEEAPPEIIADFLERGVYVAGGGALIRGVDKFFETNLKVVVMIAENPLSCVVAGTELLLDEIDLLERVQINQNEIF